MVFMIKVLKHTENSPVLAKALANWLNQNRPVLAFDTETTGLERGQTYSFEEFACEHKKRLIFGISAAFRDPVTRNIHLIWARHNSNELTDLLSDLLSQSRIVKVAHFAKFDIGTLKENNYTLSGVVDCTYTIAKLLHDRRRKHDLESMTELYFTEKSGWKYKIDEQLQILRREARSSGVPKKDIDRINYSFIDDKTMGNYSMFDAHRCLRLYEKMRPEIKERGSKFVALYKMERSILPLIAEIEAHGLMFNHIEASKTVCKMKKVIKQTKQDLSDIVGRDINLNSPKQLLPVLTNLLKDRKLLFSKGRMTTSAPVLQNVLKKLDSKKLPSYKFINGLLKYRNYQKINSTYLIPLSYKASLNKGIVYTNINPTDARTGRMASKSPNLQNIPNVTNRRLGITSPVRSYFIVRPGYHNYFFDYSQMELAVFGLFANEKHILNAYKNGEDIHLTMAKVRYGQDASDHQRDITKSVNFGIIYGMGLREMCRLYNMSMHRATEIMDIYYEKFPSIKDFQKECRDRLYADGYVEDWTGRQYHLSAGDSYKAVNALVQGQCASVFKKALLSVHKYISTNKIGNIILPVHDEIQIESGVWTNEYLEKTFIKNICHCMSNIEELCSRDLYLRVSVSVTGSNWADKKKYEVS